MAPFNMSLSKLANWVIMGRGSVESVLTRYSHCVLTAQNFTRDKRVQSMISARTQTKWRLFFYADLLTAEVSRALSNNSLKMSTATPIFFLMNQTNSIEMTTTYRNFKKSLKFCFEIFEFLCCTECVCV